MKFKVDSNLLLIARQLPDFPEIRPAEQVATELCARFVEAGILEDEPGMWGAKFLEVTGPFYVEDVVNVLRGYGIERIAWNVFNALCDLIIVGDGDCPVCGGKLEFYETEGHEIPDGDRWTPNSYVVDLYCYKCATCGEIIKTEKQL